MPRAVRSRASEIWSIFTDEYLPAPDRSPDERKWGRFELRSTRTAERHVRRGVRLDVHAARRRRVVAIVTRGVGNGPVAAFLEVVGARGFDVDHAVRLRRAHPERAGGAPRPPRTWSYAGAEGQRLWRASASTRSISTA